VASSPQHSQPFPPLGLLTTSGYLTYTLEYETPVLSDDSVYAKIDITQTESPPYLPNPTLNKSSSTRPELLCMGHPSPFSDAVEKLSHVSHVVVPVLLSLMMGIRQVWGGSVWFIPLDAKVLPLELKRF
jgi:hypothetical protein